MDFKTFQEVSKRPLADLGNEKLNVAHLILGIISEYDEIIGAINKADPVNIGEEVADVLFFIANYYTWRGYDLKSLEPNYTFVGTREMADSIDVGTILIDIAHKNSMLSDIVKKWLAYDREIDRSIELDILSELNSALGALLFKYDLNVNKVMQNNHDKLKKRYPNSFSNELANNRDLEAERIELEK